MPALDVNERRQSAVLWPVSAYDEYGKPTVGTYEDIRVRWITGRKASLDSKGNTIALDAQAVVGQVIEVDSRMWLAPDNTYSAIEQWLGSGSSGDETETYIVVKYDETPDGKNRDIRRTVGLAKYKDDPS